MLLWTGIDILAQLSNSCMLTFQTPGFRPSVAFIDRLMVEYPDAKFILTIRDADSWYKSVKNTIWQVQHKTRKQDEPEDLPQEMRDQFEMIRTIVLDGAFDDLDRFLD